MTTAENLKGIALFEELADEQREIIAGLTTETTCNKNKILFNEGRPAKGLYILLEGKVAIKVQLTSSPERITIASLSKKGSIVGWSGMVNAKYYTATAECQEDTTLYYIDTDKLWVEMENDCSMGAIITKNIMEVISSRMRNIQQLVLKTL